MSKGKHFSFETLHFKEVIAHNGRQPILFHRACEEYEEGVPITF